MSSAVAAAAGGMLALLFALPRVDSWTLALLRWALSARTEEERELAIPGMSTYVGYVLLAACVLPGIFAAALAEDRLRRAARRLRAAPAVLAALLLVAVVILGWRRNPWLGVGAPLLAFAMAPFLVSAPAGRRQGDEGRAAAVIALGAEFGCVGLALHFPYAQTSPALTLVAFAAGFAAGVLHATLQRDVAALRAQVAAGVPTLALPFVGLVRSPTHLPLLIVLGLVTVLLLVAHALPAWRARMATFAGRHALDLALPALVAPLVLPFRFRELPFADSGGHESQHLGWINSVTFGKLLMADAGFIYGPLREYLLGLLAWAQGGLTLEHVRVAHIVVNAAGVAALLAAARRAGRGSLPLGALALVLVVSRSAIVALVNYTNTIGLGWVDELRPGLASLAVVLALVRPSSDGAPNAERRRLVGAGVLIGLASLYSQDFGVLGIVATGCALLSESFVLGASRWRSRLEAAGERVLWFGTGAAVVLGIFSLVYAARGRFGALTEGVYWSVRAGVGLLRDSQEPFPVTLQTLLTPTGILAAYQENLGIAPLDFVVGPVLGVIGLGHAAIALVRRRFTRRTSLVLGLSIFCVLTQRHPLLAADGWHVLNALGPALVLLVALLAEAPAMALRIRRTRVPLGIFAVALAALWPFATAAGPLQARLVRLASGEERPSFGPRYQYADLPRAGDIFIEPEHVDLARFARAHARRDEPILSTTWLLGGGIDAFLAERRNVVPYDVPHEAMTAKQHAKALAAMKADPPKVIIGSYFTDFGPEFAAHVDAGFRKVPWTTKTPVWMRNEDLPPPPAPQPLMTMPP